MTAPILSIRHPGERREAAGVLASGAPVAFYIGLFILVKLLRPPWLETDSGFFWRVKPGRPSWSKLPVTALPRHSVRLVDGRRLHPAVRHLTRREEWEGIWERVGAPLHVIAPVRPARFLHPALVTSPVETALPAPDRFVPVATSAFFWFDDADWRALAHDLVRRAPGRTFLAGTSFNEHGSHPPYTLAELHAALHRARPADLGAIVTDPVLEDAGVFSSHTMVRLPLVGEDPALVITRDGPVSAGWLEAQLGLPVRRLDSAAVASRRPGLEPGEVEARARCLRRSSW